MNSILNSSQLKAVEYQGGHLLIVAGPGTGKTHTLTYRIAQTAKGLQASEKILAITFTNKAAEEMRSRLLNIVENIDQVLMVGTFHQFCLYLLKGNISQTTLSPQFQIATEEDIKALSKDIWPELKSREIKNKLEAISRRKAQGPSVEEGKDTILYNNCLRKKGFLDFDDLLCETVKLLQEKLAILTQIQKFFPYIFVDEYQDINPCQHELLKLLVGEGVSITAIGDPNQAIYGFRGADVRFFQSFADDFQGATTIYLSENYRSAQNLLSASGQVMAQLKDFPVPELTTRIYSEGQLIIHESPTEKAESEFVVHQIEKMVGGTSMFSKDSGRVETHEAENRSFGDIAVLCRLKVQLNALKEAFERSGIPYEMPKSREEEFIDHPDMARVRELYEKSERVQLMTLHAAKGLEFPVVFIVGCEENLLPLHLDGLDCDDNEERRLSYVGMTRAKEKLYCIYAKQRFLFGKSMRNAISPFVLDIEEKLKQYEKTEFKFKKEKEEKQLDLF
ncbi:MAG: ATP-dependent helicase [Candidatus Omnitrophica bacterium]|nr:ATP-dependent helicase [Candidatus Omnitrophota bacterium]